MVCSVSKIRLIKAAVVLALALLAVSGLIDFGARSNRASAASDGPSPAVTGAPWLPLCPTCPTENNCTVCHTGDVNSGPGSVTLTGLPANYQPNQVIPLTVTVSDPNATIYGFQMVAINRNGQNAGTITFPAANPQPLRIRSGDVNGNIREYVEHTSFGVTPTVSGQKSWTFNWTAPPQRIGKLSFYAAGNGANSDGSSGGDSIYTTSKATLSGSAIANFDTDTTSDISVFRPSNGTWYTLTSSPPRYSVIEWGAVGDKVAPGDYDGDGSTDFTVFRPSNGTWYTQKSSGGISVLPFGQNGDVPVPGDYDGDSRNDLAVFRPSNNTWYIQGSAGSYRVTQFGVGTDRPAQGDYDGDGKTDIAVFRPSNFTWYMITSSGPSYTFMTFGAAGDLPVQADYDGDGRTDIAVFRPSNATWYSITSLGYSFYQFGATGDRPIPADYDGDGRADLAVFRNGVWYVLGTFGPTYNVTNFGQAGDVPVAAGYIAE